jgi:hypothetical protein
VADKYLLENGVDAYLLEDASGVLILEGIADNPITASDSATETDAAVLSAQASTTDSSTESEAAQLVATTSSSETVLTTEGAGLTAALTASDNATLTESASASSQVGSQDATDTDSAVLAEIEALLADVAAVETGLFDETSDPPPLPPPAPPAPEAIGVHVPGPLVVRAAPPVDEEDLVLMVSAWLSWHH